MRLIQILLLLALVDAQVSAATLRAELLDAATAAPVRVLVSFDAPDKSLPDQSRIAAVANSRTAILAAVGKSGLKLERSFSLLPAFAATVDANALRALAADPRVRRIELDSGGTGAMLEARPLAHVDILNEAGHTGAGQRIAVVDSGIALSHLDFTGRIVDQQCFCSGDGGCCPNGSSTQSGPGAALDDHGHGTNVSGIAAAGGAIALPGVASAAGIVSVKVLDANNRFCCTSDVLAAFDWLSVQHPEVKIVNASLGTSLLLPGDCDAGAETAASAVALLAENDTLLFASAGNQANANAMSIPACLSGVMGIGAVWDRTASSSSALGCTDAPVSAGLPTCFSNSSAGTDLYAPGALITSSGRSGGLSSFAGTSQATPLSAGCAVLLRAAHPTATSAQIRNALTSAPTAVVDPKNGRSFPLLDCADALEKLELVVDVNHSGIYYAAANGGYGVAITHQDQTVVAIWYTFDANGRPSWFTASAPRAADGRYRGDYHYTTGIALGLIAGAPAAISTVAQGSVELEFTATGGLIFGFAPLAATTQTRALERLALAASVPVCRFTEVPRNTASNYSDLWWNPAESGWGLSILHQGDNIFLAWYTFATDGRPQWLTALLLRQPDGDFAGRLNRAVSGTPYTTTPIGPVTSFPLPEVGDVRVHFNDGERATLSYSVDGFTQAKPIQRLVFGARVQICE